jgi:predicted nucleic acid-binding protein
VARPLVPDTTAFIAAIRQARRPFFEAVLRGQVWLSTVVVCELYAGTRSQQEARLLDQLVHGAHARGRLLVPGPEDWVQAGRLLARRARLRGALRPRDHLADVLIVISAGRLAGEVLTANRTHFDAWAELARRGGSDVVVAAWSDATFHE